MDVATHLCLIWLLPFAALWLSLGWSVKNWCQSCDTVRFEAGPKKTMSVQSAAKSYHFSSLGVCVVLVPRYSFQLSGSKMIYSTMPKKKWMHFWAVAICCLETYPSSWHFTHVTLVQSLKSPVCRLWDFKWTFLSNYFTPCPVAVVRFEFRIQPQHLPSNISKLPETVTAQIKAGKREHEICS